MAADPDVDLIVEALDRHRVTDVGPRAWGEQAPRWRWVCRCGWAGVVFDVRDADARAPALAAAVRHVAERVAEALRHGAPETAQPVHEGS